jgi:hypothetical protein
MHHDYSTGMPVLLRKQIAAFGQFPCGGVFRAEKTFLFRPATGADEPMIFRTAIVLTPTHPRDRYR